MAEPRGRRLLIVDDHAGFRAAARALVGAAGFVVVGEAADGAGAIRASAELRPDVVLLDVQLPDLEGFAVAERLAELPDPPAVVFVSSREARTYGARPGAVPSVGFLTKDELSGPALARMLD